MKTIAVMTLLLSATAWGRPVRFTKKVYSVGTVIPMERLVRLKMQLKVRAAGGTKRLKMSSRQHVKKRVKVLAHDGSAVIKVRVKYLRAQEKTTQGGRTVAKPDQLAGKAFTVESRGKTLVVTHRGKPASTTLAALVVKDMKSLVGKPDNVCAFLPTRPIKRGELFKPSQATVQRMFNIDPKDGTMTVSFTFLGARRGVARFRVAMRPKIQQMTMNLRGKFSLRVNGCWPLKIDVSGPMSLSGGGPASGSGNMGLRFSNRYGGTF